MVKVHACGAQIGTVVLFMTLLTDGWTCKMIWLFLPICGVRSSATPEKNGCVVMEGEFWIAPVVVCWS